MSDGTLIARFTQPRLAYSASPRRGGVTSNYAAGIPQLVTPGCHPKTLDRPDSSLTGLRTTSPYTVKL
jgi:hypothetical protein